MWGFPTWREDEINLNYAATEKCQPWDLGSGLFGSKYVPSLCADEIGEQYGEFKCLPWILNIPSTKKSLMFEVIILLITLIWSLCFMNEYVLDCYTVPARYMWSECTKNKNMRLEMVQLEKLHRHEDLRSIPGTHIKASCAGAGL